jgi:hypothetical protein
MIDGMILHDFDDVNLVLMLLLVVVVVVVLM